MEEIKKITGNNINLENSIFEKVTSKLINYIKLIPFSINEEVIKVAGVDEQLIKNANILKLLFKKKIEYYVIQKKDFDDVLEELGKKHQNNFYHDLIMKELEYKMTPVLMESKTNKYITNLKNNTIVDLVNNIIEKAILMKASDIHFNPLSQNVSIKVRVEGDLLEIDNIPKEIYEKIILRIKVLSEIDTTKQMVSQDGKIPFSYDNHNYDIRTSVIPTLYGERISLRILDNSKTTYVLEDVFMNEDAKIELKKILDDQNGLILVVGPTGSGKTTTLYSLLKKKIDENVNIITVEDPIEYTINGITQVQINEEIGTTYIEALKSVLRQDPDVFMIGEIRDKEAAEITVRAALTGHLVFSTIHANDSLSSIYRLIDFGISTNLIVNSLRAIIYQKLIKRICPICHGNIKDECGYCNNTGEKGRLCVAEVLIINDEIKKAILNGNSKDVLNILHTDKKFKTMSQMINIAKEEKIIK